MKILDRAAKLERTLLDRLGQRKDIARHPIEVYRAILDECEDVVEAGTRDTRIFPYDRIDVVVATRDTHQRATAEAVFAEPPAFEDRVRERLQRAGCVDVKRVAVALSFADAGGDEWSERDYRIDFSRRPAALKPPRPAKATPSTYELQLTIVKGKASKTRYALHLDRVNLGRIGELLDRQHRMVRQNHIVFVDGGDDASQSVSRAHAHIRFDQGTGNARLHDDGSTHGTRIVRAGRTITVPGGVARGVALKNDDEVVLGQARMRVEIRRVRIR